MIFLMRVPKSSFCPPPPGRVRHSLVPWGDYLMVYGGQNEHDIFADFWMFSLTNLFWEPVEVRSKVAPPPLYGLYRAMGG